MNEHAKLIASPTEERNPRTEHIDQVSTRTLLTLINDEDSLVPGLVRAAIPALAELVDAAAERVRTGGRVHYFGAGTSGRLGYLDAVELVPTFGVPVGLVVAHQAGGDEALVSAVEDVEDDLDAGATDARDIVAGDVVIGLAASGGTPYVGSALRQARAAGALTALITSNPDASLAELADYVLVAETAAEAITGSTRLKAGTAQKLFLNSFSTALMVRLGRSYSNLMIEMQTTNGKLRGRAITLLRQASGAPENECQAALDACKDLKTALVYLLVGEGGTQTPASCRAALAAADGRIRAAVEALTKPSTSDDAA